MQIVPAQFGKSWQLVRQVLDNTLAGNKVRQPSCRQSSATSGDAYSLPIRTNIASKREFCHACHNTETGRQVVGKRLPTLFCTGMTGKVLAKLRP